jgi:hypothetical protein
MNFPFDKHLDIRILGRIYDNTVATYKFYWFMSMLDLLATSRKQKFTFWEIIAGMVAEAWYPIHYFRLSFGRSDSLYERVIQLQLELNIPISSTKDQVRNIILSERNNPRIRQLLNVFTLNVPYRFLSPWIPFQSTQQVIDASIRFQNNCLYSISGDTIVINPLWEIYLIENYTVLRDYTYWGLINFVQRRNPNVPNLPAKLQQTYQRENMNKQRRFWDTVLDNTGNTNCIYTGKPLGKGDYDLDHFVPWSFVTHNLIWNLLPADPSVNSSKSNALPPLEKYLQEFSHHQQKALQTIYRMNPSNQLLEEYLMLYHSLPELIALPETDFEVVFRNTFSPMVQIAENMGFQYWNIKQQL